MNRFTITIIGALILGLVFVGALISHSDLLVADSPSNNTVESTIEAIYPASLAITVRVAEGEDKLILPVVSPAVMEGVQIGDRVSLDLAPNGVVMKIVRIDPSHEVSEPR